MDLREILQPLLEDVAGLQAALLLDRDGMLVSAASRDPALDREAIAAQASLLARQVAEASARLGHEAVSSIIVEFDGATLAVQPGGPDLLLAVVLRPGGNVGRALYEGRRAAFRLREAL